MSAGDMKRKMSLEFSGVRKLQRRYNLNFML